MAYLSDVAGTVSHQRRGAAVPGWVPGVALLAWRMMNDQYRVVCGLYDQHPLHTMHSQDLDSYTAAIDLRDALNDPAERCTTPSLVDACQPYIVQQSETTWVNV